MNFGQALSLVRNGEKIQREGWNGKGLYVVYQKAYPDGIPINANTAEATGIPEGTVCKFHPYLMLCYWDNSFVPWHPSQTDILATDWITLEI